MLPNLARSSRQPRIAARSKAPPNKALQLTGYRVFQSTLVILLHGTWGAPHPPRRRAGS